MKTILLLIQLTIATTLFSQGNLQFNRAVNIEMSSSFTTSGNWRTIVIPAAITITVPVGKTLKITRSTIDYRESLANTPPSYFRSAQLLLNSTTIASFNSEEATSNLFFHFERLTEPMWLPAGTYTLRVISKHSNTQNVPTLTANISGIEFNILP